MIDGRHAVRTSGRGFGRGFVRFAAFLVAWEVLAAGLFALFVVADVLVDGTPVGFAMVGFAWGYALDSAPLVQVLWTSGVGAGGVDVAVWAKNAAAAATAYAGALALLTRRYWAARLRGVLG